MTIFSKIVAGEIPAYVVAETIDYLAFLDIMPLAEGHVLVIPKKEVDYLFDMEDDLYTGLQIFAKIIAGAIKKAIPCKRVGVAVIGLEVPHAHIHLHPHLSDIAFTNAWRHRNPWEKVLFGGGLLLVTFFVPPFPWCIAIALVVTIAAVAAVGTAAIAPCPAGRTGSEPRRSFRRIAPRSTAW